jgi:hypothetical protein
MRRWRSYLERSAAAAHPRATIRPADRPQAPREPRTAPPTASHAWCVVPAPTGFPAGATAGALTPSRGGAGTKPFGPAPELSSEAPSPELERIAALAGRLYGASMAAIAVPGAHGRGRVCLCRSDDGRPADRTPRRGRQQLAADVWALACDPAIEGPVFIPDTAADGRCVRTSMRTPRGAACTLHAPGRGGPQAMLAACHASHYPTSLPPPQTHRSSSLPSVLNGQMRFFACAPFFGADGRWMGAM